MDIKGTITSIPFAWKNLLDSKKPLGIKVDGIELIGSEKLTFGMLLWALGTPKGAFKKRSNGSIAFSDSYWTLVDKSKDSDQYFFLGGGAQKVRHGSFDEAFDTIYDFHGVNLLDEEAYEAIAKLVLMQAQNYSLQAQFDMNKLVPEQINWLKKRCIWLNLGKSVSR